MKFVGLNGDLLDALIEAQFPEGIAVFLAEWQARFTGKGRGQDDRTPDRATIYRWIKDGSTPRRREDFLRLCSLLDVDPICLLRPRDVSADRAIEHLLSSFQIDRWRNPALGFLAEFFGRQANWPPPTFARERYHRPWIAHDFTHDPAKAANFYAMIELPAPSTVFERRPQIHHFAYRIPGFFRDRWLEFGVVERFGRSVKLYHINGFSAGYDADPAEPARVETWFGPGSAVFRAASLHEFALRVIGPNAAGLPAVRFPG